MSLFPGHFSSSHNKHNTMELFQEYTIYSFKNPWYCMFIIMSAADSCISIGLNANEYSYLTQNISVYFSLVSLFLFDEFIFLW